MSLIINRRYRDALYDGLMTDFTAIGDIFSHLHNDEPAHARRLHRRFEAELRLLDDLGWEQDPDAKEFELTMPARELRPDHRAHLLVGRRLAQQRTRRADRRGPGALERRDRRVPRASRQAR
jgi:hypothetical protein